jgi:hypothetical protein
MALGEEEEEEEDQQPAAGLEGKELREAEAPSSTRRGHGVCGRLFGKSEKKIESLSGRSLAQRSEGPGSQQERSDPPERQSGGSVQTLFGHASGSLFL